MVSWLSGPFVAYERGIWQLRTDLMKISVMMDFWGRPLGHSLKQIVKSSSAAQRLLTIPLWIRRYWLVRKYDSAFKALSRLATLAQHDMRITVTEFDGTFTINAKSALFQRYIVYGYYEPAVSRMFLGNVDPGRDVIGVLSIEPTANAFRRLEINVKDNGVADKVIILKVLLSDAPGEMSVNVIDGQEEYASVGELVHRGIADKTAATELVQAVTLDSLVAKYELNPALIKIDVEGSETKVLSGAIETLKRFQPYIMAECSDEMLSSQGSSSAEICKMLVGLGYRIVNPESPDTPFGSTIAGDIFCIPMN